MNKIFKFFRGLWRIFQKPYLINLVLETPAYYQSLVVKKYGMSRGFPQLHITDFDRNFNETVEPYAFLEGGSTPMDLAMLKKLARHINATDYLEIGTWRGESVANMAKVVKRCYTLNLPTESLLEMGKSEAYAGAHKFFSKDIPGVTHIAGHSHTYDFEKLHRKFDIIFIDGDHHYDAVKKDTATAFKLLKNQSSIIVWHDYGATPEHIRWDVMLGILDGCPDDKKHKIFHIDRTLCAAYIPDMNSEDFMTPYSLPDYHFKVDISINNQ